MVGSWQETGEQCGEGSEAQQDEAGWASGPAESSDSGPKYCGKPLASLNFAEKRAGGKRDLMAAFVTSTLVAHSGAAWRTGADVESTSCRKTASVSWGEVLTAQRMA